MNLKNVLWVFFISILPLIELRGAIPVGAILELPFYVNYICAVIGNLLPVPFILIFIPKILDFMYRFKKLRPIVLWLRKKANKNAGKIMKDKKALRVADGVSAEDAADTKEDLAVSSDALAGNENAIAAAEERGDETSVSLSERRMPAGAFIGLMLFVLLPIPGTGAWTGSLVSALFGFPKRLSFLATLLGVLGCGVIMCLASYGVLGFLSFLL